MYGYCGKCNDVVEGEKTGCSAMEKIFHINCFGCTTCGMELQFFTFLYYHNYYFNPFLGRLLHGDEFYVVDQEPFCEKCYLDSLEKCTVCSDVIKVRVCVVNVLILLSIIFE